MPVTVTVTGTDTTGLSHTQLSKVKAALHGVAIYLLPLVLIQRGDFIFIWWWEGNLLWLSSIGFSLPNST
jgi:hypothetical protein